MKIKLKPIKEQVVVVFGASSGIGRETALRFARKGAKVVVAARGQEGLRSLIDEIAKNGGEAVASVADTTHFAQVQAVADLAVETYGRIDTWVHAAAVAVYAPFTETTPDEFARIIHVNLVGQAYGAMAALPHLRVSGGALIPISSVEAERPLPLHSAYAASKHGVHGMVETLRMELKHEGAPVSVTEIMPASINTPFFNKARTKIGVKPMGLPPIYEPGVVADAILYAAAHPVRELVVGGAGKFMVLSQRAAPRATDAFLTLVGFKGQETEEKKSAQAPSSLYGPIPGYDKSEGDFGKQAKSKSLDTWFGTHPLARLALLGGAVGGAVLLARRGMNGTNGAAPPPAPPADSEVVLAATETVVPVAVVAEELVMADDDAAPEEATGPEEAAVPVVKSVDVSGDGNASRQTQADSGAAATLIMDRPSA